MWFAFGILYNTFIYMHMFIANGRLNRCAGPQNRIKTCTNGLADVFGQHPFDPIYTEMLKILYTCQLRVLHVERVYGTLN